MTTNQSPLIAHVVFRFDYGGLENGVANIANALHGSEQRHVVIALTEATAFKSRLKPEIEVFELQKRPGRDWGAYRRLYRLLRRLRPQILHTRNVGTMDCAFVGFLARVPVRIHGEHGWDVADPDGTNPKYRWFRRIFDPFVHRYVTVSKHLANWLQHTVRVRPDKIEPICNGVDVTRFQATQPPSRPDGAPAWIGAADVVVVGSVCRFSEIKHPLNLVNAFIALTKSGGLGANECRLVMAGDGPLHKSALETLTDAGVADRAWLPGSRDDVPTLLAAMDVFVLGSWREGISNTILEAMASGLPVIATATGGNVELVDPQRNGATVPTGNSGALATAIQRYVVDKTLRTQHGAASRAMAHGEFSLETMLGSYSALYSTALEGT
ncbi:MAG: TIGR03088 family PEP-CTERM/XrtA system glycosyltransferase [Pseudomonadota bacterium]